MTMICLLYTSDAADDSLRVDLGGRRIIKKACLARRAGGGVGGWYWGFFKQKTAYEIGVRLVGSEMCIRDRLYMECRKSKSGRKFDNSELFFCGRR